jgi:uncharacterized protein YdaU (DUF1376 family)
LAEFPALPFWTDAYLGDTTHFTTTEHGAYVLLLVAMWRSGQARLPADESLLCRISRATAAQWKRMKPTLFAPKFLEERGGYITQGRLTDEWDAVRQNSRRQSDKAKARWLKNKGSTYAAAMPEPCRTDASLTLTLTTKEYIHKGKRPLPENWHVPERAIEIASKLGVDWKEQAQRFRDYLSSTGKQYIDYDAAFCNFIRNAPKFNGGSNGHRGPRPLQDDRKSVSAAADRLIEADKRGEFTIKPRPSLIDGPSDLRLLPKGRGS